LTVPEGGFKLTLRFGLVVDDSQEEALTRLASSLNALGDAEQKPSLAADQTQQVWSVPTVSLYPQD
jgi:hypothetical protein